MTLSQPGSLQSLSFHVVTAAGKLRLGLYDSTGPNGGPGKKLAETGEITPVVGWNTASALSAVVASGTYWLAYLPSDNGLAFNVDRSGAGTQRMYSVAYGPLPAVFSTTPTSSASQWSFYGTFIPGTVAAAHSIQLNWDTSATATSYNLYKGTTTGGPYSPVISSTTTAYLDQGLNMGTYFYVATAVNDAGESGYSNEFKGVVP
jgi:hypothetical protein